MSFIPATYSESTTTFRLTGSQTYAQVVLGHQQGTFSGGNAGDMASAVFDAWENAGLGWLDEGWTLDQVDVRANTGGTVTSGASGQTPVAGGASGAQASTPAVSVLIRKGTDQGGRHGRGRMYLPGMQETWTTEAGVLESSGLAAVVSFAAQFLDELDAVEMPMRLLHVDETLDPAIVLTLSPQTVLATQRRRQRR